MPVSSRRFVSQLAHQEPVDEIFLASEKQLRPNRNGNLYLQVDLSDRSGTVNARLWNASESDFKSFENGDYVRVEGTTQLFQGAIQLIATNIRKAQANEVDQEAFMQLGSRQIESYIARLTAHLRKLKNPQLLTLAECFLMDEEFMRKFSHAPAGVKNHHAYVGGLLEHVVSLMDLCSRIDGLYPELNGDLMMMGAFLHDMGKIDELMYERELAYSDEGQLIGHLVMAIGMLEKKLKEAERLSGDTVDTETVLRLKHVIVSHHGQYEYGSPKLPMTLEAIALCQLDNLDAKLHNFTQIMRDDPNVESSWTNFNPPLGRKLFKGGGKSQGDTGD